MEVQLDVFNEVGILEKLRGGCASELLDYGVDGDHFVLVQRRYRTSLGEWRRRLPREPGSQMRLYLAIFADVVQAVKVHFLTAKPRL